MDNQRTKMLGENLTHYRNLQENGSVNLIEFHTADRQPEIRHRKSGCHQAVALGSRYRTGTPAPYSAVRRFTGTVGTKPGV